MSWRESIPTRAAAIGPFGGRYVPETLFAAFEKLEAGIKQHLHAPDFQAELTRELSSWVGRPTALTRAPKLSKAWGAEVWLKREDLAHTGAHKINNALGQAHARQAAGREARRRRDRRRPAWRRQRRGLRARRPAVHGVHGRGGHGAPGAERRPHEAC